MRGEMEVRRSVTDGDARRGRDRIGVAFLQGYFNSDLGERGRSEFVPGTIVL
jgi:hypothetical protein